MATKICVGDYVSDVYQQAQFHPNRFRVFRSAHAWFRAPRHIVTRLFWGGSWESLPPRRAHRFLRKIRQTTLFRARKCLLGSRNQYLRFGPPFSPKTAIFRRDLEFFSTENKQTAKNVGDNTTSFKPTNTIARAPSWKYWQKRASRPTATRTDREYPCLYEAC